MEDLDLRALIYRRIVETGTPPSRDEVTAILGSSSATDAQLQRLHNTHMIVLDDRPHRLGEIRMALPFSAEPTDYIVTSDAGGTAGRWWANCAWDALAVVAALQQDARIESTWTDTGERLEMAVTDSRLDRADGYIHFRVPARHWWDDIVFT